MAVGRLRPRRWSLTCAAAVFCAFASPAWAQDGPVTLYADQIQGLGSGQWTASGNVEVLYGDRRLYAHQAHYDEKKDEIIAKGQVRLVSPGIVTNAPEATLKIHSNQGIVLHPRFLLPSQDGHGQASSG
ncbi:MAG: LPS-assembly protein LptD, partial [Acidithiobacillus sp.]